MQPSPWSEQSFQQMNEDLTESIDALDPSNLPRSRNSFSVQGAMQSSASGNFEEAFNLIESAKYRFDRGSIPYFVARGLFCLYFLNQTFTNFDNWRFHQSDFMVERARLYPHRYSSPEFPYFQLLFIVPCACLTIIGLGSTYIIAMLIMYLLKDSLIIVMTGLLAITKKPYFIDELTAKHLSLVGSSLLILSHSLQDKFEQISVAGGQLLTRKKAKVSMTKSVALLVSRLSLAVLMLTAGWKQILILHHREWALRDDESVYPDGHDNLFLVIQAILSIPFILGFQMKHVTTLLTVTLLTEAFVCWSPFHTFNSVQYNAHVRSHFFVNISMAGGLLMLLFYGPGKLTLDGRGKKDE